MAAYAQFGYGYPSANQLLGGGSSGGGGDVDGGVVVGQSNAASGAPQGTLPTATAPSPLSGINEASLSPSGCSTTTGVTTGPLSPGAISQTSNNAGTGASAIGDAGVVGGAVAAASIVGDGSAAIASVGGTSCCENGRPIVTDPVSGQTVCSCQYDSARLALSSYSRMPAGSVGVYGTPYPSTEQNPYPSIGVDSSAFYSPLGNPYGLKDSTTGTEMTAWTSAGLQPTTGYYSYDPTLAAYGYGAGYDLAARRKNATRESTATLKAWLNEHKKNPYPTKGEKIMLAIITKMTLTQVSTWFANARRRLKKENKMTWEPKNKTEDDDDAMLSDDEKDVKDGHESEKSEVLYGGGAIDGDNRKDSQHIKSDNDKHDKTNDSADADQKPENLAAMRSLSAYNSAYIHPGYNPYQQQQHHPSFYQHGDGFSVNESNEYDASKNQLSRDCGIPIPATKPKIWSLADTVACKTPPPASYLGQQYYSQQQSLHHPHSQQQQMSHNSNNSSSSNSSNSMQMEQSSQRQQQASSAAVLNSPLSMMNSYVAGSPYSRIPTGYGTNVYNSSNSNNSTGMPTTPTSPPTMGAHQQPQQQQQLSQHHHQQQHQLHQQHQHHLQYQAPQQQQRMGFSEIQPDTPPQTPPNMKHTNANSSAVNSLQVGPTTAPMTGMCYASSSGNISRSYSHEMPTSGNHISSNYVGIMATSRTEG